MKIINTAMSIAMLLLGNGFFCLAPHAQEDNTAVPGDTASTMNSAAAPSHTPTSTPTYTPTYTPKGADTCMMCHDEDSTLPIYSIFKTKHAQPADKRTPFAGLQCEACHGPGEKHAQWVQPGEKQAPIITFGKHSKLTPRQQNQICLKCHRGQTRIGWDGSPHESNKIACTDCHRIHVPQDPVLATRTQPQVCYRCHKRTRSEFLKPSKHPVRYGRMDCSDCHQVHGSTAVAQLNQPTVNETCYTCHAEKRGPLLWEHAPVTEDCRICHAAHGSVQPALLKKRPPLLCQQCHSQFGHPSVPRSADGLPGNNPSVFLLAGSCVNCHSQIHGSNNPSGATLMR
jgi:DmsE family decaheme c-type cytochrome